MINRLSAHNDGYRIKWDENEKAVSFFGQVNRQKDM